MRHIGLVVALMAAFTLAMTVSAGAELQLRDPLLANPAGTEFAVGTLGGFAGGLIGMWSAYHFDLWLLESQGIADPAFAAAMAACYLGYPLGEIVGASLGVIGTGWALKDKGNELRAVLGSAVGFAVSLLILFNSSLNPPMWAIFSAPAIGAAVGATFGYHSRRNPQ